VNVGDGGAVALAPAWRDWVLEQLGRGLDPRKVTEALEGVGVDVAIAAREVAALVPAARLAHGARVRRMLGGGVAEVDKFPDDFWEAFWQANRPLLVRGYARDWPAVARWSPAGLVERLGDVPLEVEVARDPERHFEGRWEPTSLAAFAAYMLGPADNTRYAIARNENLRRPELAPLFDDVVVDERFFDRARLVGGSSLWLGPAGTLTPLHFDTTNILFVQIHGQKRFWLAPPDALELVFHLDGFYVDGDLERLPAGLAHELVLAPGDALFVPVAWFHRVLALAPSVSWSLLCFRRPNDFSALVGPLAPRRRT